MFTGLQGTVRNYKNIPLLNATVQVLETGETFEVTKNLAHFKSMVPAGQYTINVSCHGYESKIVKVHVWELQIAEVKVLLADSLPEEGHTVKKVLVDDATVGDKVVFTDSSLHEPFQGDVSSGIKGMPVIQFLQLF